MTTKNLNVATFRNGDTIRQAKTDEEWKAAGENNRSVWCYYENDTANGTKYGKLYNWYAVNDRRGLAPAGYHIPIDEEWTVLSTFLGGEDVAGKKMKNTSGWKENGNGTKSRGFSGLPGGYSLEYVVFSIIGNNGHWWGASESDDAYAWNRYLYSTNSNLFRYDILKHYGLSVRCVKDLK